MEYNPESHNAMFARIEQKLDSIQESIKEEKVETSKLAVRVSVLEQFRFYLLGAVSLIGVVSSYIINKVFTNKS